MSQTSGAQAAPRLEKLRRCIREAFGLFDKIGNGTVPLEDVPAIMRYLGQFPPQSDVDDKITKEVIQEEGSTTVPYEAFEKMMLKCLMEHEYDPDDSEVLMAAFRVLDPAGEGWIDAEVLRRYMMDGPNGFREKEMSEFLEYAKDKTAGEASGDPSRIYYEDYVAKLTNYVDHHIENLYQDARGNK